MSDVIDRRIAEYRIDEAAYVPVEADGFKHVYDVFARNLRTALKTSQDFSLWMARHGDEPAATQDKFDLLETWLALEAEKHMDQTNNLGPRAWKLFDDLVENGGQASPGEYDLFMFDTANGMRHQVKLLEEANLATSTIDETDKRRKTIQLLPRGWLVNYFRTDYTKPGT